MFNDKIRIDCSATEIIYNMYKIETNQCIGVGPFQNNCQTLKRFQ